MPAHDLHHAAAVGHRHRPVAHHTGRPLLGSLFSGYGGLDLAAGQVLGTRTAWVSDVDPGAAAVLAQHWPGAPNHGDITGMDWSTVERVDVLAGGFPCQDLSHAGARGGLRPGTRSGLWSHMAHAIDRLRPDLVIAENVRGLLSADADSDVEPCPWCVGNGGPGHPLRALGAVLGDLADLGYDAAWCGLRAGDVGAAHARYRVFVLAWPADTPRGAWWLLDCAGRTAADTGGEDRGGRAGLRQADTAGLGRGRPDDSGLLPTPLAADADRTSLTLTDRRGNATLLGALLPTPRASDGTKGGPGQRGSSGDLMLPSAVALLPTPMATDSKSPAAADTHRHDPQLRAVGALLPSPAVNDMGEGKTPTAWDAWTSRMKTEHGNGNGHGASLAIEALRVSEPGGDRWGRYAAAVTRWEALTRTAPAPTQPGSRGTPQLAAGFVEWLMGLPAGHVTDPAIWADLTDRHGRPITTATRRRHQLKALGNGVVPQQATAAITYLLDTARAQAHRTTPPPTTHTEEPTP